MDRSALSCLNCQGPIDPTTAVIVLKVMVCGTCGAVAIRLIEKGEAELQQLRLLHREAVRVALATGKLHLGKQNLEEMDKRALLEEIVKLQERHSELLAREPRRTVALPLSGSSKFASKKVP